MKDDGEPSCEVSQPAASRAESLRLHWPILFGCLMFLCASALLLHFLLPTSSQKAVNFKGKTLELWFYGTRNDFFKTRTREAAQGAIDALGTNALPFLFARLDEKRGNGFVYYKFYQAMLPFMRRKLPYPISGDDVKAIALQHIGQMRSLPGDQVQALAERVPKLRNPRLRMMAFNFVLMKYQADPAFLGYCRRLLDDKHAGLQLQGAIYLGQSALRADPGEPKVFPILIAALESKERRKLAIDLQAYTYQQQPAGGTLGPGAGLPAQFRSDPDPPLRSEIMRALDRLEQWLKPEQKKLLDQIRQAQPKASGSRSL